MFCESCGHQMSDGAKFCPSCGAAVRQDVTEEEPATSAPSAEGMPETTDWATKPIKYAPTQPMPQPTDGDASPVPTEPLPTPTAPGDTGRMAVPVIPTSPMSVVPSPNPYSDAASERHPASGVAKWILIGVLVALLLVFAGFAMGFLGKSPSPSDGTAGGSSEQVDGKKDDGDETDKKKDEEDDKADGEGKDAEEKSEKKDDGNDKKTDDEGDEEDKKPTKVERMADGYMLPDSDKHRYSASELSGLSDWELKVARNEIYAKHGYRFESDDLREHFEDCEWYEPTTSAGQFDEGLLNDVERYNVGLILSLESHDDEYVLPDSSVRRYSRSELTGLSNWELKAARNEIYARHGCIFESGDLREHFEDCSWYEGRTPSSRFDDGLLSDIERHNVDLIASVEEGRSSSSSAPRSVSSDILPYSSTRKYSRSELSGLSSWQLKIARNEIYGSFCYGFLFPGELLGHCL